MYPDLRLINCKEQLDLSCKKDCVLIRQYNNISNINFKIKNKKTYAYVFTLSINKNIKFLEQLKQGFRRTVSWNKYRSDITTQPNNNNLDYIIDATFKNINRLFVLLFKSSDSITCHQQKSEILIH